MAKKKNDLDEAILEIADDMHRVGVMDEATYRKITKLIMDNQPLPTAKPLSGKDV